MHAAGTLCALEMGQAVDVENAPRRQPLSHHARATSSSHHRRRTLYTAVLAPSGNRTPPLQVVNGGPLWVHVNGCAIVLSQDATQATMRSRTCLTEATLPHFSHRRTMMLPHSSIGCRLLVCCGVYRNRRRCRASRRPPRGTGGGPYESVIAVDPLTYILGRGPRYCPAHGLDRPRASREGGTVR